MPNKQLETIVKRIAEHASYLLLGKLDAVEESKPERDMAGSIILNAENIHNKLRDNADEAEKLVDFVVKTTKFVV